MNRLPVIIVLLFLVLLGLSFVGRPVNDAPPTTELEEGYVIPKETVGKKDFENQSQYQVEIIDQTVKKETAAKTKTVIPPQPAPATTAEMKTISYSDSGFSPSNVTVKKGETLKFKNDSTGNMWIASNGHPVHSDYPGFDAGRSYNPGESYVFTFDRSGSWNYHNHLNPGRSGTIIVE